MSTYVKIDYLKEHAYIDSDAEDDYLQKLLDASEAHVEKEIQCPLSTYAGTDGNLPKDLTHAIVIYAATLYANRESVAFGTPQPVPYTYRDLIVPYIKYT
jgi:uncharacterized phage protein (predicted DNA packaging)